MIAAVDVIDAALELLRQGENTAAHLLLADEFDRHTDRVELGRIANLIAPCGMIKEAKDALVRAKFQSVLDPVKQYQAHTPKNEPIGRTVPLPRL